MTSKPRFYYSGYIGFSHQQDVMPFPLSVMNKTLEVRLRRVERLPAVSVQSRISMSGTYLVKLFTSDGVQE